MTAAPTGFAPTRFDVVAGGRRPLDGAQAEALQQAAGVIRALSDQQARNFVALIEALHDDDLLSDLRAVDVPALRILAEVIRGWEPDGVREFARAWASTIVAREDGFDWELSGPQAKAEHWRRVQEELWRRGVRG